MHLRARAHRAGRRRRRGDGPNAESWRRLVLAGPYNERHYIRNVYELPDAVAGKHGHYICQQFSRAEIDRWTGFGVQVVAQRYWRFFAGEAFATGGWIIPPRPATAIEQHDHSCLTLQKT